LQHRLELVALGPEAVRVFPYDWRHSIERAAEALASVARDHLAAWRNTWAEIPLADTDIL